jgi:spore maturation protein CgeB
MRVLYLGDASPSSTSRHRAEALRRIGCEVLHLNPHDAIAHRLKGLEGAVHYRTGYCLTRGLVTSWLLSALQRVGQFDVCWVDSGEWLGPGAIKHLKHVCGKVVLFNHDDPTGPRDWARFLTLRAAIAAYDLCLVVRDFNVAEFKAIGAKDVLHVWRGYDEIEHRPADANVPVPLPYQSDVAFIGRQMDGEGRDVLMMALIDAGLKPAIWGDNWERSRHWTALQPYWRGSSLSGQNYVNALRGAKICRVCSQKAIVICTPRVPWRSRRLAGCFAQSGRQSIWLFTEKTSRRRSGVPLRSAWRYVSACFKTQRSEMAYVRPAWRAL